MVSSQPFLDEDSSINRPSDFTSECYDFWKIRTKIFIESNDVEIWNVVEEGPFIVLQLMVKNNLSLKRNGIMMINRKFIMTKKTKNILTLALGMDDLFTLLN